jgi:hypothetical protein
MVKDVLRGVFDWFFGELIDTWRQGTEAKHRAIEAKARTAAAKASLLAAQADLSEATARRVEVELEANALVAIAESVRCDLRSTRSAGPGTVVPTYADRRALSIAWLTLRFEERDSFLSDSDVLTAAELFALDYDADAEVRPDYERLRDDLFAAYEQGADQ